MTYKPVDTAIVMTVGPCIDDTDFKSLEEAIAYNAAGMDISLIVEKTDGTTAVTAITLTTGGTSDWTHKDGGYYEVEITAAQNAEEGVAYLRGVCTGVLPFESPRYDVVVANIYDSWVKGTDKLQIDVTQLLGTAWLAPGVAGTPDVNAKLIGATVQTGRDIGASVLLSAGSGAGQLDFTSGIVKSNLTQVGGVVQSLTDFKDLVDTGYDPVNHKIQSDLIYIHGTALTETDGQLAAAFKKLFDVATPLLVASDVMRGTDSSALATTALSNVTWTDLRAGYLDNISAGAVALNSGVNVTKWQGSNVLSIVCTGRPRVDVSCINSDTSTVLYLDDLVNAGYDHANHKIEGCKVNDDMRGTDSAALAVNENADLVLDTTVNSIVSQTDFELAGSPSSAIDSYVDHAVLLIDASTPAITFLRRCTAYNGATKRLQIDSAPGFTLVAGDIVKIFVMRGTDGANTTVPDAAGVAPTVGEIRTEMESVGTKLTGVKDKTDNLPASPAPSGEYDTQMGYIPSNLGDVPIASELNSDHGSGSWATATGFNTVIPDIAGTAATLHGVTDGKVDAVQTDVTAVKAKTDNLPSGMAKNVAVPKFDVFMVSSLDHVTGATGKTVTGTISKDGGSFVALTNTITEVGNGVYTMSSGLTQAERNADVSTLKFIASGCDDRIITIISS